MARAVVLTFEDNAEADFFIALHQRARTNPKFEGKGAEIELVVAVPTLFCKCTRGVKNQGWTRGLKWGWWVCSLCHKPSGSIPRMKLLRQVLGQGRNLLEERPQEVSEVTDEGWGVHGRHGSR